MHILDILDLSDIPLSSYMHLCLVIFNKELIIIKVTTACSKPLLNGLFVLKTIAAN